ncbi:hypothetical protein ACS0TY_013937 [Phlomoides rotata]
MVDDVELDVLLVTLFSLIAIMFSEINTCVVLMSYGFLNLRTQSRCHRSIHRTYSIRNGTYIPVRVPHPDIPRYRNHKGNVSVNVLTVCDHHMNFIFILFGWEGSTAYSRVLRDALTCLNCLRVPNECGTLKSNSYYPIKTQNRFILGCCLLHNFKRKHMVVDPYEDEVPEVVAIDEVNVVDGFIDQVKSYQARTTMRDNLAM